MRPYRFTRGTDGNDTINTGRENDMISGGAGKDRLNGGAGDDYLLGGSGDDNLTGGRGDDLMEGNSGDDEMKGGYGADQFIFPAFNFSGDQDYIADMKLYEGDILRFKNGVFVSAAEVMNTDYDSDFLENDPTRLDIKVTLTDQNSSATQTVWLIDAFNNTDTIHAWDNYFTTLGYSDFA
jgi:Ca2+-binding RTX toxin-like protein